MALVTGQRFPTGISYGSAGGPLFSTTIVPLRSGRTVKNQNWEYPLQVYNLIHSLRSETQMEELRDWFYALAGQFNTARFKDPYDYKSCALGDSIASSDQILGTGDGSTVDFDLVKTYTVGSLSMSRPTPGVLATSLIVEVGGATTAGYTRTPWTNTITFATAPATGAVIKAGFEFDVLVEFGVDQFNVIAENCNSINGQLVFAVDNLPLREVRAT